MDKGKKLGKSKKSQIWYVDFMVGVLIFITIIIIYYQYSSNLVDESEAEWQEMIIDSKAITSSLVSAGYPENWTAGTVEVLGLTGGDYRIDATKLLEFKNMSYSQAKDLFKTRFDFYFYLKDANDTIVQDAGVNATNHTFLVHTVRFVIYNSSINKMGLYLWKK